MTGSDRARRRGWHGLCSAVLAFLLVHVPRAAEACSVCSTGREDENRFAFIITTVFLSVLPLTLIGGLILYFRRRFRALEARAPHRDGDALARS